MNDFEVSGFGCGSDFKSIAMNGVGLDCRSILGQAISMPAPFRFRVLRTASPDIEFIFNVPANLRLARLRPIARPGRFNLGNATVQVIGKLHAVGQMLRTIAAVDGVSRAASMLASTLFPDKSAGSRWQARHRIVQRYLEARSGADKGYADWIRVFEVGSASVSQSPAQLASQRKQWRCQTVISVVLPVYNTEEYSLRAAIDSVLEQTYPHWQLCIANDCSTAPHIRSILSEYAARDARISVVYHNADEPISETSSSALALAAGAWVALLDHHDCLHKMALHFVAEAIAANPRASLIYSDEDKIDQGNDRYDPHFKCDYNYELLLAHNMIGHLVAFRRGLIEESGGFRKGFESAQHYDLVLRATERLAADQIVHVPRVLYHRRTRRGNTAFKVDSEPCSAEAARRAVTEHLQRRGVQATVVAAPEAPHMNRVKYSLPAVAPLVSIIICTRDRADLLAACIDSIIDRSTYSNYEVWIVDNGSTEEATFRLFSRLPTERFRILQDGSAFNFSALNNRAVQSVQGEYICLLNNDIEILTPDWIEEMLSFSIQPGVGAVGARLWFPDGGLQHAGVILGLVGLSNHVHRHLKRGDLGYFGRAALHQSFSAVTGAALMIKKSIYQELGVLTKNCRSRLTISTSVCVFVQRATGTCGRRTPR